MADTMIEADGLFKSYGETRALAGVSFSVPAGSVLGLLGPNGAGKTTAVRILTTLARPDAGQARVAGIDVLAHPAAVRRQIGVAAQDATLDGLLTGRQNLVLVGELSGMRTGAGPGEGRRAARALRAGRRRRPGGQGVLRRHAAPAGPGGQPADAAARAVPGRADHGPGPGEQAARLGGDQGAHRLRRHAAADHPVPGRGGRPGGPHRGSRSRPGDRRRDAARAEGTQPQRARRGDAGRARAGSRRGDRAPGRRPGIGQRRRAAPGRGRGQRTRPGHCPGPGAGPGGDAGGQHRGPPALAGRCLLRAHRRAYPR